VATFLAFVAAGAVPLVPYLVPGTAEGRFVTAIVLSFVTMFAIGAARALIANVIWWRAGAEMLGLGVLVTMVAYGSGALIAALLSGRVE
jgi:VIT1/CCC1 family predicted Fe2+/Mn2+ transporter